MKKLLAMIEAAKRDGIRYMEMDDHRPRMISSEPFFKLVEQCQPFVFPLLTDYPTELPSMVDAQGHTVVYLPLDPPFSVFSIEVLGADVSVPLASADVKANIHCIMAYELEPRKLAYYVHGTVNGRTVVFSSRVFDVMVKGFVDRINSQSMGVEAVREKVKLGQGREKRFHTFRRLVHVYPKAIRPERTLITGKIIDWSHRWHVRGHWRAIEGMGKNREGVYCVEGNTWVSAHVKGPESAPLVVKTHIVHES